MHSGGSSIASIAPGASMTARPISRPPTREERVLAVVLLAAAAILALLLLDPAASRFFPPCPLRLLTGWLCPGCGATRGVRLLLLGRPAAALRLNPLLPAYLVVLGHFFASQVLIAFGRLPLPVPRRAVAWGWGLLVAAVAFGVARNLPGWPWPA